MIENNQNAVETTPAQNGNSFQTVDVTNTERTVTAKDFLFGNSAFYEGRTFKLVGVEKRIILNEDEIALRDKMLADAKAKAEAEGADVNEALKSAQANFISKLDPSKRVNVVFTTDIGDDRACLWLSSYRLDKTKLDNQTPHQPVYRDGDFDKAVYAMMDSLQPTDDMFVRAKAVFEQFKDATIIVKRKFYKSAPYGRTATIPCFHTVK